MEENRNHLTKEQIDQLEKEARDPIWNMGIVMGAMQRNNNWDRILMVSGTGLIHFHGNDDTGWQHINMRHQFRSSAHYFGKGKQGNPSKFTDRSIPFEDYRKIADDVFLYGLIDSKEHKDGKDFRKYIGKSSSFIGSNGEAKEFNLILYRDTKIVHSIYPKKDLEGKQPKRLLEDFARATNEVKMQLMPTKSVIVIGIPYIDRKKVARYVAVMEINLSESRAVTFLQIYTHEAEFFRSTNKLWDFQVQPGILNLLKEPFMLQGFLESLGTEYFEHIEKTILEIESDFFPKANG
ncbi:MAG: hypothetical protein IAE95_11445 [Chitinophagaceae bacterium]|nr:hypothetical protein [Chitinophagaceae bacterium]